MANGEGIAKIEVPMETVTSVPGHGQGQAYGLGQDQPVREDLQTPLSYNPGPRLHDHKDSGNRYLDVHDACMHKDFYLRFDDGKLDLLRVQRVPNYNPPSIWTNWERPMGPTPLKEFWHWLRHASPNIVTWTYRDWLKSDRLKRGTDEQDWWHPAWRTLYWKYPCACLGLTFTALFGSFEGHPRPGGKYPSVRYRYFRYSREPRNHTERPEITRQLQGSSSTTTPTTADNSQTATAGSSTQVQRSHDTAAPAPAGSVTVNSESSTQGRQVQALRRIHPRRDDSSGYDLAFPRHLRPRWLCVIPEDEESSAPYVVKNVDEWDKTRRAKDSGEYVFVSYTRSQFQTNTQTQIDNRPAPKNADESFARPRLTGLRDGDLRQLCQIGILAAQKAGVNAFWIDVLCMDPDTVGKDSHRICDIARGANRLVIAVKDLAEDRILEREPSTVDQLLQNWASRLWTLPEMLLAPTQHGLEIYRANSSSTAVRYMDTIAKRNMAARAYMEDGELVRQLVDHFESNLHLTQTELLTLGLECLMGRAAQTFLNADPIYALMTLARRRPDPNQTDTLFDAFARLSLLNDSNQLLERLICLLPRRRGDKWYKMEDYWSAKLWDIVPTTQVAAIDDEQTVILDGAFGASIDWGELKKVGFIKRKTLWRTVAEYFVRLAPGWLILGISTLAAYAKPTTINTGSAQHAHQNPAVAVGIIFFFMAVIAFCLLPAFMLSIYRGKFWETQALFIGLEGMPDLDWLEARLFGFSEGRLKWSSYSSTLSRHHLKTHGHMLPNECEADTPSEDTLDLASGVRYRSYNAGAEENSAAAGGDAQARQPTNVIDQDRIFTLVDTYTMTVTPFRAVHPPSVVFICGHEGGMRRAVLCSYDYKTQTFHRETVLRLPTKVLDRMDRVERFRFSMDNRPLMPVLPAA